MVQAELVHPTRRPLRVHTGAPEDLLPQGHQAGLVVRQPLDARVSLDARLVVRTNPAVLTTLVHQVEQSRHLQSRIEIGQVKG